MIFVDFVMTTFAPKTASFPTLAPSTNMHLEPMNEPSSTMTGEACKGSKTPPIPTPPLKCTFFPICAH